MKWKPINEFENYEISDTGLIRTNGKILTPFDNKGYQRILLTNGSTKTKKLVHRLVAEHFIPTEDTSLQVNHRDLNKQNNRASNLEWVTCKENVQHAIANIPERRKQLQEAMSLIGRQHGKENSKKSRKSVEQRALDGELIKIYSSAREASTELGISYKCISKACNGGLKTYKGFLWNFATCQSQTTIERIKTE